MNRAEQLKSIRALASQLHSHAVVRVDEDECDDTAERWCAQAYLPYSHETLAIALAADEGTAVRTLGAEVAAQVRARIAADARALDEAGDWAAEDGGPLCSQIGYEPVAS